MISWPGTVKVPDKRTGLTCAGMRQDGIEFQDRLSVSKCTRRAVGNLEATNEQVARGREEALTGSAVVQENGTTARIRWCVGACAVASVTLKVELSEDDKAVLSGLQNLADREAQKATDKSNALVLSERGRALEQVKRLYAVVMGFAIWSCITNSYQCARKLWNVAPDAWDSFFILFTQLFSVLSLIALFFLGAERMLDRKYLQPDTPNPPKPVEFLGDLITIGAPAILFVIIANAFPLTALALDDIKFAVGPSGTPAPTNFSTSVRQTFWYFVFFLIVLYAVDALSLLLHQRALKKDNAPPAGGGRGKHQDLLDAYWWWSVINTGCLVLMSIILIAFLGLNVRYLDHSWFQTIHVAAAFILVIQLVRFGVDFYKTFPAYYPQGKLEVKA